MDGCTAKLCEFFKKEAVDILTTSCSWRESVSADTKFVRGKDEPVDEWFIRISEQVLKNLLAIPLEVACTQHHRKNSFLGLDSNQIYDCCFGVVAQVYPFCAVWGMHADYIDERMDKFVQFVADHIAEFVIGQSIVPIEELAQKKVRAEAKKTPN